MRFRIDDTTILVNILASRARAEKGIGEYMGDWDIGKDWMSQMEDIGEKTLGPAAIHGGLQLKRREQNRAAFKGSKNGIR